MIKKSRTKKYSYHLQEKSILSIKTITFRKKFILAPFHPFISPDQHHLTLRPPPEENSLAPEVTVEAKLQFLMEIR